MTGSAYSITSSTMSASGMACVIAAMYYSSLMPRTCLCARLLETLD